MSRSKFLNYSGGGPKAPCTQDCADRSSECHAHCKRYLEYEKEREDYRLKKSKAKLSVAISPTDMDIKRKERKP